MASDSSIYFDIHKTLDYGCFLNFLIGGRGVGKSYAVKKYCIEDFIKRGRQFLYVRRTQADIDDSFPKFLDDLLKNDEFADHDIKIQKDGSLTVDGCVCGYTMALSTAGNKKSIPFPNVYNIMFDEVFRDSGSGYLRNEVHKFLELLSTTLRLRNGRVFLISNALSVTNPYFTYFEIRPSSQSPVTIDHERSILINMIQNSDEFNRKFDTSPIGRLIRGTKYDEYARNNKFLLDSDTFVMKKTGNCSFWFNVKVGDKIFGLWVNRERLLFVSKDNNLDKTIITINGHNHDENSLLLARNDKFFKAIQAYYRESRLFFESIEIKNEFMQEFICLLDY